MINDWRLQRSPNTTWFLFVMCVAVSRVTDADSEQRLCLVFLRYFASVELPPSPYPNNDNLDCTGTFVIPILQVQQWQNNMVCCNYWLYTRVTLLQSFLNLIMFTDDPLATHINTSATHLEVGSILKMLYHSMQWKGKAVYA